jgi:hypothetical protein
MWRAIWFFIIFIAFLPACTRDTANECSNCPSTVSFKSGILPIFAASCAMRGCHDVITHAAAVILDSANAYANVTAQGTGFVTPYDIHASILYTTLNSNGVNGMPKGLPPIPQCQVEAIACWINQGALNN